MFGEGIIISLPVIVITAGCILVSLFGLLFRSHKRTSTNGDGAIPSAPGGAFFLIGHALAYKKDPNAFFRQCRQAVGPVFRINLAGRNMIVVANHNLVAKMASQPENVLSSADAVLVIGFDFTLGEYNVKKGTNFHKRVMKQKVYKPSSWNEEIVPSLRRALEQAFQVELLQLQGGKHEQEQRIRILDLFVFVRRCFLRTCLVSLVGSGVVNEQEEDDLVSDLLAYMDQIENATAKAAVLPRNISVPLVLRPTAASRHVLQEKIKTRIASAFSTKEKGPWMRAFAEESSHISQDEAASLVIGLMFAAHKNPSIGTAQTLTFLLSEDKNMSKIQKEAKNLLEQDTRMSPHVLEHQTPFLFRATRESLRLSALTIGSIRQARKDIEIVDDLSGRKYCFRSGDTVCLAHQINNTDPQYWGQDAFSYRPERWKERKDGEESPAYLTFSLGVHRCPGERLAMAMIEIMVALFLEKQVQLVGPPPELCFERATLAQRKGPVCVTVAKS